MYFKTKSFILMSALAVLMSSSCINENAQCPTTDDGTESFVVNLNLTVPSSAAGTRTETNEVHVLSPGNADECYINVEDEDYQILIFGKGGALVEDKLSEIECTKNDNNGNYTLTAHLTLENDEDRDLLSKFRMMVLVNWKSFSNTTTYPSFAGKNYNVSDDDETESNIFKNDTDFNFTLPEQSGKVSWVPSITDTKAIPMFGISEVLDLQYVSEMGKYSDGPSFNVPMLRSLAKIEIVDMVPGDNEEGAKIDKCVLTKYNTTGRFIPDITKVGNTEWDDPKKQIGKPSLPGSPSESTELQFFKTKKSVRPENATSYVNRDCFVVYIPEMEIGENDYPVVDVYLNDMSSPIYLGDYDKNTGKISETDGEKQLYKNILRNHSYNFNIMNVGIDTELTLWIESGEWDNDDDIYYYDDLEVKFTETSDGSSDGNFKWQWEKNNVYIKDPAFDSWVHNEQYNNQNIADWPNDILAQWTGKYLAVQKSDDSGAIATFNITAPERGSWTLALYSDDDTGNHWFYIERWDEETQEWVNDDQRADPENDHNEVYDTLTGKIAGKNAASEEVKIKITARELQYTEAELSARLVMNVTTFDGRMAEVNLMTGKIMDSTQKSDDDYYHIIQIPTPTN